MRITQLPMKPGSWELTLKPDTSHELTDRLRIRRGNDTLAGFGHLIVTPEYLDPTVCGLAGLTENACYIGRYLGRNNRLTLRGDGIEAELGTVDGRGVLEPFNDNLSFTDWMTEARNLPGGSVTAGNIEAIGGGTFSFASNNGPISPADLLYEVCRYYAAEWRLNPDLTFDAGTVDYLYGTTPTVLFHPNAQGPEPGYTILGGTADFDESVEDYNFIARVYDTATGTYADGTRVTYLEAVHPWWPAAVATPVATIYRRIDALNVYGSPAAQATAIILFEPAYTESLTITVDAYDPKLRLCGDTILAFHPDNDIIDETADQIIVAGEICQPLETRVMELEYSPPPGAGYFLVPGEHADWVDRTVIDLTEAAEPGEGWATLTCGRPIPGWEQAARVKYADWLI